MRLKVAMLGCLLLAFLVAGCGDDDPTPTRTPEPTVAPTVAPTLAPTNTPVPPPTPAAIDPDAARSAITALLMDSLTVTVPITSDVAIEGAVAFPLTTTNESVLWLAHTIGMHSFDPPQYHVLAVYTPDGDGWREVARQALVPGDNADTPDVSPDFLGEGGVTQIAVEPDHIWIQLEGGVGAHSGVYGLYSFDGTSFTQQISSFSSSPGVGRVEDVNGDGVNEVLVDATDFYVFCYACGVRAIAYNLWYWDGAKMSQAAIQPLPVDAPTEVTTFNNELLALVQAGLWKDAQAKLADAAAFSYTDPIWQWNLALVRVNAEALQAEAEGSSAYPLLSKVFYGDYAGAVEVVRAVGADGLFIPTTELIFSTVAEGWQAELADRLTINATNALAVQPDLAAAYFIRGLGAYVRSFVAEEAIADLQKAAELAPDDELYTKSVEFLTQ